MIRKISLFSLITIVVISCSTNKNVVTNPKPEKKDTAEQKIPEPQLYRAANTITNLVYDTKAEVSFDWEKKWMYGKATLTMKPYFYPVNHLDLNARGMELREVSLINPSGNREPLKYVYENDSIKIDLPKTYTRNQSYVIFIDYIAKPEELTSVGGSAAITSDKGLYFINAEGSNKNKPRQIWTQGETQATSVWLPTIDSPNQRMYQQISMTVDTQFVTLSNGLLVNKKDNGNGTRTDTWKMSLPHAPYLAMMAVGPFAVVKDKWRSLDVDYYVEPEYAPHAKAIFGNTPEMLEFFSKKLGVDYPWEKYSQVVVRDYVSGAMENTTATLHGEFLQTTTRQLLDNDNESVISHELFHQWFGDLVTCESWANISLNESFATYGEYLWDEYKYGRDQADHNGIGDLNTYMMAHGNEKSNLIRFDYNEKEDVFDAISYQKGGRILHMLRSYVGDEAFFESLRDYLNTNKFTAVEAHQLRLSFEKVTGRDLNWFWNQWFYNAGHPVLAIDYDYDKSRKVCVINVKQKQNFEKFPLFRIPVNIDVYAGSSVKKHHVVIEKQTETIELPCDSKPEIINFDSDKTLVCKKADNHTSDEWAYLYFNGPLYNDRKEALEKCKKAKPGTPEAKVLMAALNDKHYALRRTAIAYIATLAKNDSTKLEVKNKLVALAQSDPKASVRSSAISALVKNFRDKDLITVYTSALSDSSYGVMGAGLTAIGKTDSAQAIQVAKKFETSTDENEKVMAAETYGKFGNDNQAVFMNAALKNAKPDMQMEMLEAYSDWMKRCSPSVRKQALDEVCDYAANASSKWVRFSADRKLKSYVNQLASDEGKLTEEIDEARKNGKSEAELLTTIKQRDDVKKEMNNLEARIAEIEKNEKDEMLKRLYGSKAQVQFDDSE